MAGIPTYFIFSTTHGGGTAINQPLGFHPWVDRATYYALQPGQEFSAGMTVRGMVSGAEGFLHGIDATKKRLYLDGGRVSAIAGLVISPPAAPATFVVDATGTPGVSVTTGAGTATFTLASGTWVNTPNPNDKIRAKGFANGGNNNTFFVKSATSTTIVVHDQLGQTVNEGTNTGAVIDGHPNMMFLDGEPLEDVASPGTVIGRFGHYISSRLHDFWWNYNPDVLAQINLNGEVVANTAAQSDSHQYLYEKADPHHFKIIEGGGPERVCYWDSSLDETTNSVIAGSILVSVDAPSRTFTLSSGSWVTTPKRGSRLTVSGFSNGANNGTFAVESATSSTVTVRETSLVTEAEGASVTMDEEQFGRWVVYHPHRFLTYDDSIVEGTPNDPNLLAFVTGGGNHMSQNGGLGVNVGIMKWLARKHEGEPFAVIDIQVGADTSVGDLQNGGQWRPGGAAMILAQQHWDRTQERALTQAASPILGEAAGDEWDVKGFIVWTGNSDILKFRTDLQSPVVDVSTKAAAFVSEIRARFGGQWSGGVQTGDTDDNWVALISTDSRSYELSGLLAQSSIDSTWEVGGIKQAMLQQTPENFATNSLRQTIDAAADTIDGVLLIDMNRLPGAEEPDDVFASKVALDPTPDRSWFQTDVYIEKIPQAVREAVRIYEGLTIAVLSSDVCTPVFAMTGQSQLVTAGMDRDFLVRSKDTEYLITDEQVPELVGRAHSTDPDFEIWNASTKAVERYDVFRNTNTGLHVVVADDRTTVRVDVDPGPRYFYRLTTGTWTSIPVPGATIQVAGFTDPANNGSKTVVAATSTEIEVSNTLVAEPAGDVVDINSHEDYPLTNSAGIAFGPEAAFYVPMRAFLQSRLLVLKSAWSSSALTLQADPRAGNANTGVWHPAAGNLLTNLERQYERLHAYMTAAGRFMDFAGWFYFQGFSDAAVTGGVPQSTYRDALLAFIDRVRDRFSTRCLGNPFPFVILRSPSYYRDFLPPEQVDAVRAAQDEVQGLRSLVKTVDADALEPVVQPTSGTDVHLDGESTLLAGELMVQGYKDLVA